MSDPAAQLTILRAQRDAAADPALRVALDAAIAALEAALISRDIATGGGDYAEGKVDKRHGAAFVDGVAGPLHQHFYNGVTPAETSVPPPPFIAAEVSQLRQRALAAAYLGNWVDAADLLARLVERDPADTDAAHRLDEARGKLRLYDRYAVARLLRQAGEWQATLGALDEIAAVQPEYPDPDGLRVWAEAERLRAIWEPRFGPVYTQVAAGRYAEAVRMLGKHLAAHSTDETALRAAALLVEDNRLYIPARERVACGALLAQYGDPRPGVCDLPPAMVELPGGRFQIGLTAAELKGLPQHERSFFSDTQNERPVAIDAFALTRYPVTNAQYQLFMEDGGYDPQATWWNDAARAWLARDDAATKGLADWQRRKRKHQPEFWDDETFGSARPNSPVVGISWYEAIAFCRWLTRHLNDGFEYLLPSEAEWEYAARGLTRRTYPWGNDELDPERASYDQTYGFGTVAVGCFPRGATPEGLFDLAGNVWEWTRSEHRAYPYDPTDGREAGDGPVQKNFTVRGGSWRVRPIYLRAAYRRLGSPDGLNRNVGFRLARHPNV